jgi:hypothetical protein
MKIVIPTLKSLSFRGSGAKNGSVQKRRAQKKQSVNHRKQMMLD